MDWYKAKTILIAFLIMTNLMLLYYLVSDGVNSKNSDDIVAQSVVELLNNRNISVDMGLIADLKTPEELLAKSCDNCIGDYEEFAKRLLGTEVLKTDSFQFSNNIALVTFNGDYFEAAKTTATPIVSTQITHKNAAEVCRSYLKSVGIDTDSANEAVTEENDGFTVIFRMYSDGFKVFKTGIEMRLSKNGIDSLRGIWYNTKNTQQPIYQIKSISSALIEYMNTKNEPVSIQKTELGYGILDYNVYHENVVLIPVWQITDDSGAFVNIDAREADFS